MPDTLKYIDEVLAGLPDNTQGLITPQSIRESVVSTLSGSGYVASDTTIAVAVEQGVYTDLNPLLLAVTTFESLWTVDGNNRLLPDYQSAGAIDVPAGFVKVGSFVAVVAFTKDGQQGETYDFQFLQDGAPIGQPETVVVEGVETTTVVLSVGVDLSAAAAFSLGIAGNTGGDDITLNSMTMQVTDRALLTDPTP